MTSRGSLPTERLRVRPFRPLRYDADRVGPLAGVTSPPYDVIGPEGVRHYEEASPHNVVRLVLPRPEGADGDRYRHAAHDLAAWRAEGTLVEDEPTLFAYEQEVDGTAWRGLLGAVSVHEPGSPVVLPHEDVFRGPVDDRAALMEATGAQLEPIMLVHQGTTSLGQLLARLTPGPPEVETRTDDDVVHRLWRIDGATAHAAVDEVVGTGAALIADGHHRYAAYQEQRRRHLVDDDDGAGGWDTGLAWLVDASTHPLRLSAIHRTLTGFGLDGAVAALRPRARTSPLDGPLSQWSADLATAREPAFVLTDGRQAVWVDRIDPGWLAGVLPERSASWRRLDAVVLHDAVLPVLLRVREGDDRLGYAHDPVAACRQAEERGSLAVLMRPPVLEDVTAAAAAGWRMPRKSTSFGPKPRNGLVLRSVVGDG